MLSEKKANFMFSLLNKFQFFQTVVNSILFAGRGNHITDQLQLFTGIAHCHSYAAMPYHFRIIQAISYRYGGFERYLKVRQQAIHSGCFCDGMIVYLAICTSLMKAMVNVLQLCGKLSVKFIKSGFPGDKGRNFHNLQGVRFL